MPIKALLVEDSPADARMIQEFLKGTVDRPLLKRVDRVSRAIESLDAEVPDVVILDLSLPDSKGLATFRRVHSAAPSIPIIVLSGLDDIDLAIQTISEGAADYLLKGDISASLLSRVIRYSVERRRIAKALARAQDELAFKNQIASIFLAAPDADMADAVLTEVLKFMRSDEGAFCRFDGNGAFVCRVARQAGTPEPGIYRRTGGSPAQCAVPGKRLFSRSGRRCQTNLCRAPMLPSGRCCRCHCWTRAS